MSAVSAGKLPHLPVMLPGKVAHLFAWISVAQDHFSPLVGV